MPQILNVAVGLFYMLSSLFLVVVNGTLFIILYYNNEFWSGTYRIIKSMCAACIFQLISFFVGGVMTMTGTFFSFFLDKILGANVESAFMVHVALSLTLAVDRLLIFLLPSKTEKIRKTIEMWLLGLSWIFGFAYWIAFLVPHSGFTYKNDSGMFIWFYSHGKIPDLLAAIEPYVEFSVFAVVFVIYMAVFLMLVKLRKVANKNKVGRVEIKLLFVAVISFLYETLFVVWCCYGTALFPSSASADIFITTLWIFDSGLFSTALIVVNSSVRNKIFQVLPTFKSQTVVQSYTE